MVTLAGAVPPPGMPVGPGPWMFMVGISKGERVAVVVKGRRRRVERKGKVVARIIVVCGVVSEGMLGIVEMWKECSDEGRVERGLYTFETVVEFYVGHTTLTFLADCVRRA